MKKYILGISLIAMTIPVFNTATATPADEALKMAKARYYNQLEAESRSRTINENLRERRKINEAFQRHTERVMNPHTSVQDIYVHPGY